MGQIAASFANVAGDIQQGRRRRHELAVVVKAEAKRRHGEVRSLLTSLSVARRRADVAYRRQAVDVVGTRRSVVKTLLTQLERERQENVAAQREVAAAFMRSLTSDVRTLLEKLDIGRANQAAEIHERLNAYALDRHEAEAAWIGTPNGDDAARRPEGKAGACVPALPQPPVVNLTRLHPQRARM